MSEMEKTHVVLLRGINVGGRNRLAMKELVAALEGLACRDVKTYIQSGNVVLRSTERSAARLAERIGAEIGRRHGFEPQVLVLESTTVERAVDSNPFPQAESAPKSLHLGFLASVPETPDLEKLESLRADSERFELIGAVFYLHAPDGVGRSKLMSASEKLLGVPMTARNWRTVCKVLELAGEPG